jgi:transposase
MRERTTYVGLDVHKKTIAIAMLPPGHRQPLEWQIAHEPQAVRRLVRKLRGHESVRCCYEAGPTGYPLKRQLESAGIPCVVVAPSLMPVRTGDHIKTDHRDARKLAGLLRAGLLTEVHPPTEDEEAVRDLCRCREDAQQDLVRARHRLGKFLLRRGLVFRDGWAWSQSHRTWLHGLKFERTADQAVFEDYLLAVEQQEARVAALDEHLEAASQKEPYRTPVAWLRCFRGIATVTGLSLVAELHDPRRFHSARQLMAYLGLVPSEHSSGGHRRQGSITRAGNRHVRRLLVEAAWSYRHKPAVGVGLRKRRRGQPPEIIAMADRAQQHLCKKYRRFAARGKHHNTIVVAIARELVGYLWAALRKAQQVAA